MGLILMGSCAQRDGSWRPGSLKLEVLKGGSFLFNSVYLSALLLALVKFSPESRSQNHARQWE